MIVSLKFGQCLKMARQFLVEIITADTPERHRINKLSITDKRVMRLAFFLWENRSDEGLIDPDGEMRPGYYD